MSSSSSLDDVFFKAVSDRVIPGAVLAATSTDGSFKYKRSFGLRSLKDGASEPLELDAVLWVGSVTKIMTSVAVLQCVEKSLFTLDEDVTGWLPELNGILIKHPSTVPEGPPTFAKPTKAITLRHLLHHTSGLSYTNFGKLNLPLLERLLSPLVFEPGEGFIYGTGHDFAGLMVERATGLSLEAYIRTNVTTPLGITSFCFHPLQHPDLLRRIPDVSVRPPDNGPVQWTDQTIWPLDIEGDSGGSGAYISIIDFQKIMHSLIANDGTLLRPEMADELFVPNMHQPVRDGLMESVKDENRNNIYGGLPRGTERTYSMGGMVILEDLPGRRRKGTLNWGGLLSVFYWMDRVAGLSGIYATQVFPAGDSQSLALFAEFEKGVYKMYREQKERDTRE